MSRSQVSILSARLRSPEGAARLAQRWIDDLLAREVRALLEPAWAAQALHRALQALGESDSARAELASRAEALLARFGSERAPVSEVLAPPLQEAALRLARRPHQPHRDLVLAVLDREPVRQLLRSLLLDSLVEMARKLASPLAGGKMAKGLGALGTFAGAVGASMMGAVGGEVERQVERRARELADGALSRVLNDLVDQMSAPRHAAEQAALREALVRGALEAPVGLWAGELERAGPGALAAEAIAAVRDFAAWPGARALLEKEIAFGLEPLTGKTLGQALEEVGLREPVVEAARELLVPRIQAFDWEAAFAELREPSAR